MARKAALAAVGTFTADNPVVGIVVSLFIILGSLVQQHLCNPYLAFSPPVVRERLIQATDAHLTPI